MKNYNVSWLGKNHRICPKVNQVNFNFSLMGLTNIKAPAYFFLPNEYNKYQNPSFWDIVLTSFQYTNGQKLQMAITPTKIYGIPKKVYQVIHTSSPIIKLNIKSLCTEFTQKLTPKIGCKFTNFHPGLLCCSKYTFHPIFWQLVQILKARHQQILVLYKGKNLAQTLCQRVVLFQKDAYYWTQSE